MSDLKNTNSYSEKCNSIEETEKLAKKFAEKISEIGAFVCLYGDIGAGKTAFSKLVCKNLGVTQKVTSPSFVILNEYKTGKIPVYHFDLYRLENEGIKTITDELEEYSEGEILTLVEWAEFSENDLPFERIEIKIEYIDDTTRNFEIIAVGEKFKGVVEDLKNENFNI